VPGTSPDFPQRVSTACHDLRTPLASAFGFARTLERLGAVEGEHARYLSLIVESTAELGRLIDCLALVARAEDGRLLLEPGDVEAGELVAHAMELMPGDRIETGGTGPTLHVDRERASAALAWLAEAGARAGGDAPVRLDARADGSFVLGPIPPVMAERLAEGAGDLRAMAALAVVRLHGGSLRRDDQSLVVRFAAT
jgi:His Kinase A (phospho-acceptor) domain